MSVDHTDCEHTCFVRRRIKANSSWTCDCCRTDGSPAAKCENYLRSGCRPCLLQPNQPRLVKIPNDTWYDSVNAAPAHLWAPVGLASIKRYFLLLAQCVGLSQVSLWSHPPAHFFLTERRGCTCAFVHMAIFSFSVHFFHIYLISFDHCEDRSHRWLGGQTGDRVTDLQAEPGAATDVCCNLVDVPAEIPIKESRNYEKDIYL